MRFQSVYTTNLMFWINKRGFFPNEILKTTKKYVNNTATGNLCIQFEVMLKAKDYKNYAQHATIVRGICDPLWENVTYRNCVQIAKKTAFERRSSGIQMPFQ